MRTLLLSFFIFSCTLLSSFAQTMAGIYSNTWESSVDESLTYTLTLDQDGTFVFELFRTYIATPDSLTKVYGTWKQKGILLKLLTLDSDKNKNALASNLNNSAARLISLSPRHPDFNLVKPSLQFSRNEVFFTQAMELFKLETQVSDID